MTCCDPTIALVQARRQDATCPACGESYLADLSATVPRPAAPRTDARVQVADEAVLRPSQVPPVARLTHTEDAVLVRVRRLLCELRPDRGGPLGWAADGAPPAAGGSAWTPTLRVQTSVEVPAILPGAFASQARESTAPRLDPATTLGWLQRHGTLKKGLRPLYEACALALVTPEVQAKWDKLPPIGVIPAQQLYGRKLVLRAMAEWWMEPGTDLAPAETAADRAERVDEMAVQAERTSAEMRRALARGRGRASVVAAEGASE